MALNFGKLDFAVAFDRLTAFPLDAKSYFESYESATAAAAQAEAAGSSKTTYYFGQTIAVVESGVATLYIIQPNKTLKQVGAEVILDEKIFIKKEDGTISLKEFADAVAGAQLTKGKDGSIKWVKPDTATVAGLSTAVKSLQDTVGDSSKGLVKDVADLKTSVGAATDAAKADGSVYARINQNAADISTLESKMTAVFHFKGTAPGGQLSNVTEKEVGDVYTVGDKEYVWDGTNWTELGFTTDLKAYSTTEEMNAAIATAKGEANTYADGLVDDKSAIGKRVTAAESKITTAEGDIDALETKLTGIDTTVTAYVEGKEATINAAIQKNTDAITKLNDDAETEGSVDYKIATAKTTLNAAIDKKADKATTLAGYGITDAYTQEQINNKLKAKQDTITFDGTYSDTNPAATKQTVKDATTVLIGKSTDGTSADTINGVRNYANESITGLNTALSKNITALEETHATKTGGGFKTVAEEVTAGITALDLSGTYAAKSLEKTVSDHIADEVVHIKAAERTKWDDAATQAETNKTAIATINGEGEGSIKKAVADAKADLTTAIGKKADDFSDKASFTNKGLKFINKAAILDLGECGIEYFTAPYYPNPDDTSNKIDQGHLAPVGVDDIYFDNSFKVKTAQITDNESIVNRKYVTDAVTSATAGLTGAMHFKGKVDALPAVTDYVAGDVIIVGQKEYVLLDDKGTKSWSLLGDEGSYAVKGSIADTDIATNAGIKQSKIDGLTDALAAKLDSTTAASTYVAKETGKSLIADTLITKLSGIETDAQVNKIESIKANGTLLTITDKSVDIPAASDSVFGVVKVDNDSIKSTKGTIAIKAVSTDLLTQGTETLILNCGGAAD